MHKFEPGQVLQFRYLNSGDPKRLRTVKVVEVNYTNKSWSLLGIDQDIDEHRRFKICMMKDVALVDSPIDPPVESDADEQSALISFIISGTGNITLCINSDIYTLNPCHANYQKIVDILRRDDYCQYSDKLVDLVCIIKPVVDYIQCDTVSSKDIVIANGEVLYRGTVIHSVLTDRLVEMQARGLPFKPMVKCLENIMQNPSHRAVQELYTFLEHKNLPITEDGHILGYKKITDDWKDYYSRKVDNSIGAKPTMPRNMVCDDADIGCSKGYHIGSLNYAGVEFHPGEGRVVIVKFNPADVVSVPKDCQCQKLRVSSYQVIGSYSGPLPDTVIPDDTHGDFYDDEDEFEDDEDK